MPAAVTTRSRIPAIIAELQPLMESAIEPAAELIAVRARVRAPDAPPIGEGLVSAIHTDTQPEGVYVVAGDDEHWYGHFLEFGTRHSAPHPFLIPALEESRAEAVALGREALRHL